LQQHAADVERSQHSFHSPVAGSTAAAAAAAAVQPDMWPAGPQQYNTGSVPQQYNEQYSTAQQYNEQYSTAQQYNGQYATDDASHYHGSSYSSPRYAAAAPMDGLQHHHPGYQQQQQQQYYLQQQQQACSSPGSSTVSHGQTLLLNPAAAAAGHHPHTLRPIATSSCSHSDGGGERTVGSVNTAHTAQGSVGAGSSRPAGSRKSGGGLRRMLGAVKYMVAYDPNKC
jgi:hypothetical protein